MKNYLDILNNRFWLARKLVAAVMIDPGNVRFIGEWLRSRRPNRSALAEGRPWMTFRAVTALDRLIKPHFSGFEFGSGGSTIYFASRVAALVTIEHDQAWFANVQSTLDSKRLSNCRCRLVEPVVATNGRPLAPSIRFGNAAADFSDYAGAIDTFPDRSFDIISIDGYSRCACARHTRPKLKPGGILILDNSDRPDYLPIFKLFDDWKRCDFYGIGPYRRTPWQTSIWQRP